MQKDFEKWNQLKQKIDSTNRQIIYKDRDVWWCSIGINIGHEENGKNDFFTRPILILRKFNKQIFLGVPLTTKCKENKFYFRINFKDKEQSAMLSQIRVFESKRLKKEWENFRIINSRRLKIPFLKL
jgi:mRNA interferase MazF